MGIERKEKQCGDHVYEVQQFGAKQGRRILVKVFKLLGPALGEAAGADKGQTDGATISALLRSASESVDVDLFDEVCDAFAQCTRVHLDDKRAPKLDDDDNFDQVFAGNYAEMFQWLAFAFEVNYGSFLGASLAQLARASGASETKDVPPTESPKG